MNAAEQPPETHHRPRERGRILSRRQIIVGLTALALLGAALVGLVRSWGW